MNTLINNAVLDASRQLAKDFTLASQTAQEVAGKLMASLEHLIPPKLIKARGKDGKSLLEYRDEVKAVYENIPELQEKTKQGCREAVLEGADYRDYELRLYDKGGEYITEAQAMDSQTIDFDASKVKVFTMSDLLDEDYRALGLGVNKKGELNNPMGTFGPSFKQLAFTDKERCANAIDKAHSRLVGRQAQWLGAKYGIKVEVLSELEDVMKAYDKAYKTFNSKGKKLGAEPAKQLMAWLDSFPFTK